MKTKLLLPLLIPSILPVGFASIALANADEGTTYYYTQSDINFASSSMSLDTFENYQVSLNNSKLDSLVTWGSSNLSVASIDQNGVVSTYAVGTTVLKASYHKLVSTCVLTVYSSNATPLIQLSEEKISLFPGDEFKVDSQVYFKGEAIDATINWSSENEKIKVSGGENYGLIKALDTGTCKVFASIDYKGMHAVSAVEVEVKENNYIDLTNVQLKDKEYCIEINEGQYFEIKPVVYLDGLKTTESVVLTSDDALIAKPYDLSIKGESVGETYIFVNYKNKVTLSIKVVVNE